MTPQPANAITAKSKPANLQLNLKITAFYAYNVLELRE